MLTPQRAENVASLLAENKWTQREGCISIQRAVERCEHGTFFLYLFENCYATRLYNNNRNRNFYRIKLDHNRSACDAVSRTVYTCMALVVLCSLKTCVLYFIWWSSHHHHRGKVFVIIGSFAPLLRALFNSISMFGIRHYECDTNVSFTNVRKLLKQSRRVRSHILFIWDAGCSMFILSYLHATTDDPKYEMPR